MTRTEIRFLEDLFVYDDPVGEAGSARKIETANPTIVHFSIGNSKVALRMRRLDHPL